MMEKWGSVDEFKQWLKDELNVTQSVIDELSYEQDPNVPVLALRYPISYNWYSRFIEGYQDLILEVWQEGIYYPH